jgi:hypothetical protein
MIDKGKDNPLVAFPPSSGEHESPESPNQKREGRLVAYFTRSREHNQPGSET